MADGMLRSNCLVNFAPYRSGSLPFAVSPSPFLLPCELTLSFGNKFCDVLNKWLHEENSLDSSEDVGEGAILGGVNNYTKAFMLHPLKDQRGLLVEGSLFQPYWGEHCSCIIVISLIVINLSVYRSVRSEEMPQGQAL